MKKIDWYILKKFLVTFFFCMILFTVIAVAVDSSEKTDNFVTSGLTTYEIITQYYIGFVPHIWALLFPLFVFISVIFFTSRMAYRSEIIAILASGTNYNRMLRPYFIGGLFLATLLWFGNRYVIPKANVIRGNFEAAYIDSKGGSDAGSNSFYRRIDTNTYIGIRYYNQESRSANQFFMEKIKGGKVIYNLRANSANWDTATSKWTLNTVVERKVDSLGETVTTSPTLTINISLKPEELRKDKYLKDKFTTPQLAAYIEKEEMRGTEGLSQYKVERYRRTATSFSVLLLTFIGALIASRKTRGGSGMHLALGVIIAATFILSDRFSTVFATKGNFPPLLAAWVPNIVFLGAAFWIYKKVPK
jgi:lipopolysaccharide export system permease protein